MFTPKEIENALITLFDLFDPEMIEMLYENYGEEIEDISPKCLAKEFADKNIRVNSICPGIVHTEMWDRLKYEYAKKRDLDPEEVLPYFKKNIPMHKLVDLQDVIQAAIFLLTDCSSYLTGQSINLVGGEWMD